MGTYEVTFERNVKTTIRINAEDSGIDGGIIVNKDSSIIIDDDNIYYISGGTVTEVPVTSGN